MVGPAGARFIGRWDATNQSAWSGSAIELRFNAAAVSVTMSGANAWYAVVSTVLRREDADRRTAMLATGLAAGPHFVQMVRRAEAFNGISKFVSFNVPETAILPQQIPGGRSK